MKVIVFTLLISLASTQYSIYIKNIYTQKEISCNDNDFELYLDGISGQKLQKNLKAKDVFNIKVQSDDFNEENIFITFKCDLYGPSSFKGIYLKCNLKDKIPENANGPFYITKNHLERGFEVEYKDRIYNITLTVMMQPYYLVEINPCQKKLKKKTIKFNLIYPNPYDIIPITMALDDRYVYPTVIAMTSIITTANSTTKYDFYLMHPGKFKKENIDRLHSLEKKYPYKCSIITLDMQRKFMGAKKNRYIRTPAYYRLALSNLLPYINKIIWLDGDTLTFKDLKEMYDINMKNYYYKGFLDDPKQLDHITKANDHNICSGVLLINLKKLREDDMETKYNAFIKKYNRKLKKHDQTVINAVGFDHIGVLPARFGVFNYRSKRILRRKPIGRRSKERYTWDELSKAYDDPTILHCLKKVWSRHKNYGGKVWWLHARNSDFFSDICVKWYKSCIGIFGNDIPNDIMKKIDERKSGESLKITNINGTNIQKPKKRRKKKVRKRKSESIPMGGGILNSP